LNSVHQPGKQRRAEIAFAERRNNHDHELAGILPAPRNL
jgi:hypothetical protein